MPIHSSPPVVISLPPALLIDLDGTLYTEAGALPGAVNTVARLRKRGVPMRFVSNTTGRSRSRVAERLRSYGFEARPEELITAVVAAAGVLREMGAGRVAPFIKRAAFEDLSAFELTGGMAGRAAKAGR